MTTTTAVVTTAEFVRCQWERLGRLPRTAIPALIGYNANDNRYIVAYLDGSQLTFMPGDILRGLQSMTELDYMPVLQASNGTMTGQASFVYRQAITSYAPNSDGRTAVLTMRSGFQIEMMQNHSFDEFQPASTSPAQRVGPLLTYAEY